MNKIVAPYMTVLMYLASCTSKPSPDSASAELIPRDSFVVILTEVRLLEGAYSVNYERVDSSDFAIASYYQRLFQEHHITREQYLSSYDYYSRHLDDLLAIETEVATRLEQMKLPPDTLMDTKKSKLKGFRAS